MPSTEPTPAFIDRLERELAGSIGAASAHVMLSKVVSGDAVSLEEVLQMADETQQAIEYSQELERTSNELRTHGEEARGRQPAAARARQPEERVPVAGQPRGAHADDLDPLVLGNPARRGQARRGRAAEVRRDHPSGEPAAHQAARRDPRSHRARARRARLGRTCRSTPRRRSIAPIEVCEALARQRGMALTVGPRAGGDAGCGRAGPAVPGADQPDQQRHPVQRRPEPRGADPFEHRRAAPTSSRSRTTDRASRGPSATLIFEKFARGKHGSDSGRTGAGLGLAIRARSSPR